MRRWSHEQRESKAVLPRGRERAVRMVLEHAREYASRWAAVCSAASKIGCNAATLHANMPPAPRSVAKVRTGQAGRKAEDRGEARVRRKLRRLWSAQGVVAVVARGLSLKRSDSRQAGPHDRRRQGEVCPLDHVNRQFHAPAPNRLWLSDFTYVATWSGFVYVAFVIDAYARRIVGWRVSRTAHAGFVLDALQHALYERRPTRDDGLVHHSDRGSPVCFHPLLGPACTSGHRAVGRQRGGFP